MGIIELLDGIARVVERLAEELAGKRMLEKERQIGRGPKVGLEKTEKGGREKKRTFRHAVCGNRRGSF